MVGIEELPSCEYDEESCEYFDWVETKSSSRVAEKIGKFEKGMAMGMGKDTPDVPLLEVII